MGYMRAGENPYRPKEQTRRPAPKKRRGHSSPRPETVKAKACNGCGAAWEPVCSFCKTNNQRLEDQC